MLCVSVNLERSAVNIGHQRVYDASCPLKVGRIMFGNTRYAAFGSHHEGGDLFTVVATTRETSQGQGSSHELQPTPSGNTFGELRSRLRELSVQKLLEFGSLLKLV
jgi:hypothetical protein